MCRVPKNSKIQPKEFLQGQNYLNSWEFQESFFWKKKYIRCLEPEVCYPETWSQKYFQNLTQTQVMATRHFTSLEGAEAAAAVRFLSFWAGDFPPLTATRSSEKLIRSFIVSQSTLFSFWKKKKNVLCRQADREWKMLNIQLLSVVFDRTQMIWNKPEFQICLLEQ